MTSSPPVSQTLYGYDGWRLVSEVDGLTGQVVAEHVPGPGYVDDRFATGRDGNASGNITAGELRYPLTDQQYSTVALLDETGAVVERYGYDPFGAPSIYNADATTTLSQSAVGNARLYTGREWLPERRYPVISAKSEKHPLASRGSVRVPFT